MHVCIFIRFMLLPGPGGGLGVIQMSLIIVLLCKGVSWAITHRSSVGASGYYTLSSVELTTATWLLLIYKMSLNLNKSNHFDDHVVVYRRSLDLTNNPMNGFILLYVIVKMYSVISEPILSICVPVCVHASLILNFVNLLNFRAKRIGHITLNAIKVIFYILVHCTSISAGPTART